MLTFTIITCTYNAAAEIERTLESVRTQTYPNIQHVIIDGASTDGTVKMIQDYQERCAYKDRSRSIMAISAKDHGLYDAMNKGLALTDGDYLVFLNAGDTLHSEDTIAKIADQLTTCYKDKGEMPGVVYGKTDIVDDEGRFLHARRLKAPEKLTWRSFMNGMLVCHQAFYAKASIARQIKYNLKYRFSADVDWCIRVMKETEEQHLPLHNTHLTLCNYLEGGMSVKNHRASLIERFRIMAKHYGIVQTSMMHLWFCVRRNGR